MRAGMMQMLVAVAISGAASVALATASSFSMSSPGATDESPYKVRFAIDGMEVQPEQLFSVAIEQPLLRDAAPKEIPVVCPPPGKARTILIK
jgi:hypothetical protein